MKGDTIAIDSSKISKVTLPEELVREMRSSIIFMGALLARFGEVFGAILEDVKLVLGPLTYTLNP